MTAGLPVTPALLTVVFLVALATTIAGALIAVLTTRIIRSVCGLALCCIGLAGLYYFLHSPFLALMQILIYVGAVCITIVFAVMLAEPDEPAPDPQAGGSGGWLAISLVAGAGAFVAAAWLSVQGPWWAPAARTGDGSLRSIGILLLTKYSLAFEVISLVLLVAIVGALAIARGGRDHL